MSSKSYSQAGKLKFFGIKIYGIKNRQKGDFLVECLNGKRNLLV